MPAGALALIPSPPAAPPLIRSGSAAWMLRPVRRMLALKTRLFHVSFRLRLAHHRVGEWALRQPALGAARACGQRRQALVRAAGRTGRAVLCGRGAGAVAGAPCRADRAAGLGVLCHHRAAVPDLGIPRLCLSLPAAPPWLNCDEGA